MSRFNRRTIIFIIFLIPLLLTGFAGGYFIGKIWLVSRTITLSANQENSEKSEEETERATYLNPNLLDEGSLLDEKKKEEIKKKFSLFDYAKEKSLPQRGTRERINVLFLGKAVPGYPGSNLTDTIILASVNPTTYQGSMLSIPRDLYVEIPGTRRYTKINSIYVYGLNQGGHERGIKLLEEVVTKVTGQKIDYYAMVNFDAFEKVIDAIAGVDVQVEEDIYDNRYPGPNYSYQTFEIKKGMNHLDGATALKYVRVRHNAGGDFGRARRQQQIVEAAKDKFFQKRGIREGISFFNEMLKIVEGNVKTDIGFSDYFPFLLLVKDLSMPQVVNKVLDNQEGGLLESYNPVMGRVVAYTLRPRSGNYFEIHKLASNIFNLDRFERYEKLRRDENSKVAVIAHPGYASYVPKTIEILRKNGYKIASSEGYNLERVFVWQRKSGAKIPASDREGEDISLDSLISKIEISPVNLKNTVIYDNSEGKKLFSLDDLARRLDAQVSLYKEEKIPADFVVVIGANFDNVFEKDDGEFFLTEEGLKQEEVEGED